MRRRRRRSTSRSAAWRLALVSAILFLWAAADAGAAVVRLQVDWAPSDGTTVMTPPYLFAEGNGYSSHQGVPPPSGGGGGGGQGPKPVLGSTVVVKVKGELVRIRRPGTSKFVELKGL